MKIQNIMTRPVGFCQSDTNLAAVATMMCDKDCGIIPLVDSKQKLVSVITDRDICLAVASKHKKAEDMTAGEVKSGPVFTCKPDDDVKKALGIMREKKVRRLPVVDPKGKLVGIVSLNDFALVAEEKRSNAPTAAEILNTLKSICEHRSVAIAA
ncbi:MAG: CBS protein [uncultured bacterium]|nr:MAG: CBS protein [uncultured bacterium]